MGYSALNKKSEKKPNLFNVKHPSTLAFKKYFPKIPSQVSSLCHAVLLYLFSVQFLSLTCFNCFSYNLFYLMFSFPFLKEKYF